MFPDVSRYLAMKEKASKLPEVEVTEEEFIAAQVAEGTPLEKAKFNATISKGLGASTMVGERMLKIKG